MKKRITMLILAAVLAQFLGIGAAAANRAPQSANVMNLDTCVALDDVQQVCVESKGVIKQSTTPSGLENYVANYRETLRVFNGTDVTWEETSDEHVHALSMNDLLKVMSGRSRYTVTSYGTTFCVQYHLHGTNGVDQFVRTDFCELKRPRRSQ